VDSADLLVRIGILSRSYWVGSLHIVAYSLTVSWGRDITDDVAH